MAAFEGLLKLCDFFFQEPVGGNIEIDGDRATTHFYVNEIASDKEGKGNYNLSQYEDDFRKIDGKCFFVNRNYKVIYLDQTPLKGFSFKI